MRVALAAATLAICTASSGVMAQIPTCTGANEVLVANKSPCPPTCDNPNPVCDIPQDGSTAGPACECADGFRRELKTGVCVLPAECPFRGPRLECTTGCKVDGRGRFCRPGAGQCTAVCDPGNSILRLLDGFNTPYCAPDDDVYFVQCPTQTCMPMTCSKPNEIYIDCGLGETSCDPAKPPPEDKCHGACMCETGFSRDLLGNCVDECPVPVESNCGVHEVKGNTCQVSERACGNSFGQTTEDCVDACVCDTDNGYVRDFQGECIKEDECPLTCGQNEVEGKVCTDAPEKTCANDVANFGQGTENCIKACVCDTDNDYVRDFHQGECIKVDECPLACGQNEVEGELCTDVPENTCANYATNYGQGSANCDKSCVCAKGHVRQDSAGPCILMNECCECPAPTACPEGFLQVKVELRQQNMLAGCNDCESFICVPSIIGDGEQCVNDEPRQCESGSTCLQSDFGGDYGVCAKKHHRFSNARALGRFYCDRVEYCYLQCERYNDCQGWEYEDFGYRGNCRLLRKFGPYYKVVFSYDLVRIQGFSYRAFLQLSTYRFTAAIKA